MLCFEISNKRKKMLFLAIYLCKCSPSLYVLHFSFKYSESEEALVSLLRKILIIRKFTTKAVHNIHFIYVCYLSIIRDFISKIQLTPHQCSFHHYQHHHQHHHHNHRQHNHQNCHHCHHCHFHHHPQPYP